MVTVVSASIWEPSLVSFARASALVRVPRRCSTPAEVEAASHPGDTIVVGGETPWMVAPLIERWRASGRTVVGIAADQPAHRLLTVGGCDLVLPATTAPAQILSGVLSLAPPMPRGVPPLVAVIGPRGAPGATEVAIALAWSLEATLVDLDPAAPSLGLRLGLPPFNRPHQTRIGPIEVLTLPPALGDLSAGLTVRLVEACRSAGITVADCGIEVQRSLTPEFVVVVTDGTPMSLLRTGRMLSAWTGPTPHLVANRIQVADREAAVRAIRSGTGLDPAAILGISPKIYEPRPLPGMVAGLADLAATITMGKQPLAQLADL